MSEPHPAPDHAGPADQPPQPLQPDGPAPPDAPADTATALPTAAQLDQLEGDLDHIDAVLAQPDEER